MLVGYMRVSSSDDRQTVALQRDALVAAGVAPGDRVAMQVEKSATALTLYLAAVRAGAVPRFCVALLLRRRDPGAARRSSATASRRHRLCVPPRPVSPAAGPACAAAGRSPRAGSPAPRR